MILPSLADYLAAFRHLRDVSNHSDLKAASVWLDPSGDPVVFHGRESAVFCVRSQERKLAVKVFLGDFSDRPHRYAAISAELRRLELPYIMPFRYAPNAINIGGSSYPVGISFWADGDSLHDYIEKNLHNATVLRELAVKWLQFSRTMTKAGIAHGDLEPNNILVSEAGLKIIDYDDFYVPELKAFPSRTLGSPNFQHPRRNLLHFGPYLDNFSSWVIYTSLLAVSKERTLWHQVSKDGDQLLFTRADLENPQSSGLIQQLKDTSDKLRQLALSLEHMVDYDVPDVPALDPSRVVPAHDPEFFVTTVTSAPAQGDRPEQVATGSQLATAGAPLSESEHQRRDGARDSGRDSSPPASTEGDGNFAPDSQPAAAGPGDRPYSVTTHELPMVGPNRSTALRYGMWATAVVLVGVAAGAFWLSRGTAPSRPTKSTAHHTVPTDGLPGGGTTRDTTPSTSILEPEQPEGPAPVRARSTSPGQTAVPPAGSRPAPSSHETQAGSHPKDDRSSPPASDAAHTVRSSEPIHSTSRATEPSQPGQHPPKARALAEEAPQPASSSPVQAPRHTARPARSSYTPAHEEIPPKAKPQDESAPAQQLSTHPKFDRIQAVRARLQELKSSGVDTTTSRQLLVTVETLAVRGDSDALETKLRDLEYRLGLRASKD